MLKKINKAVIIEFCSLVFALVGVIIAAVSNATERYPIPNANLLFLFGIFGIILICASILLTMKFGNNHFLTFIARAAAIAFVAISLCLIIVNRVEVAATFSWDRDNQTAVSAFVTAMVAVGFLLFGNLVLIVSSFLQDKKQVA